MDLIAGNYSDSSAESAEDSELDDVDKGESKDPEDLIPLPDFELDSSGMGKSRDKIDPKVILKFQFHLECFISPFVSVDADLAQGHFCHC